MLHKPDLLADGLGSSRYSLHGVYRWQAGGALVVFRVMRPGLMFLDGGERWTRGLQKKSTAAGVRCWEMGIQAEFGTANGHGGG